VGARGQPGVDGAQALLEGSALPHAFSAG
jgi:hypothetical protein